MNLKIVNTGSQGNCFLFESEHQTLIVECGVPFSEIKEALNFNLSKVVGCLVSHEHGDHSKSVEALMSHGIDVYSSKGTFESLGLSDVSHLHCKKVVEKFKSYTIGEFKVKVFDACHDCAEPINFIIEHPEMGKALFVTDSYKIKYKFDNMDHYIVEANYAKSIVSEKRDKGGDHFTDMRLIKSHMSIENLALYLSDREMANTKNIILHHLSDRNSNEFVFTKMIETFCFKTPKIASKGDEYDLNIKELKF